MIPPPKGVGDKFSQNVDENPILERLVGDALRRCAFVTIDD
jgi:hypothetical protein